MKFPPEWAAAFVGAIHPVSLALAVVLPCARAFIRKIRGEFKCWTAQRACHDAAAGFVIPSFIALTLFPMIPNVWKHLDPHVFQLAGAWGVIYMIAEIFNRDD
jgi:hypothetical protein